MLYLHAERNEVSLSTARIVSTVLLATHSGRYDSLQVLGKMKNEEADFLRSGFVG